MRNMNKWYVCILNKTISARDIVLVNKIIFLLFVMFNCKERYFLLMIELIIKVSLFKVR